MRLRIVIIAALLLIGSIASADVYTQIGMINPKMSEATRVELAHYIVEACTDYKLYCNIFTAILAQESMFQIEAINKNSSDYGIGQINIKTIRSYKFDIHLLLTDLRYSIRASAKVLSWFKRYKSKDANWQCRYNVGTGVLKGSKLKTCTKYVNMVQRYQFNTLIAKD